jgi:7-carboxy-7-deazaguanine synthase (Cx14CxxC type)
MTSIYLSLRPKSNRLYKIKEIYYTLQGEGFHSGRPAVFVRFSGCNLWSGREEDRADAICDFCDTDFRGTDGPLGGSYSAVDLAKTIQNLWPGGIRPFIVCTGGEPLLQLDQPLVQTLKQADIEIAIETNGTITAPDGIDWICVSPKAGSEVVQRTGSELKLVYPQAFIQPEEVADWDFTHYYLQPMQNAQWENNTKATVDYCKAHPQWRLSLQSHKYINIP